jgi:dihydropteroate synthase
MHARTPHRIAWGRHTLELGGRTCVMGILNVTPDSFSDGGRFASADAAVAHGIRMAAAGADIIDVGGESTRPFSEPVGVEEEIRRVVPVITALSAQVRVPISVDTTKRRVAEAALAAGAALVNDVSGLRHDPGLAAAAARWRVPLIVMHMQGEPRTMQVAPHYEDLMGEIAAGLHASAAAAEREGVPRGLLIADPGIGFGKTAAHNLELIQRFSALAELGLPLLVGPSRKAFIRRLVAPAGEADIAPDSPVVETGTQAAVAAAVMHGAHIVRVHNVENTRATVAVVDAVLNA